MVIKALVCTLALAAPLFGVAQFDFGGGDAGPAWSTFKLNSKTRVKPNFQNTGVDMIVSWYSKTSGITIIKDPALTGTLTVVSAKPISLNDAFSMLNTTLSLKNFELRKEGNFLVIRGRNQDRGGRGGGGFDMSSIPPDFFSGSQSQLKVYVIQYANASQVARVVNEVFATTQNPMDQFMQMMQGQQAAGRFGGGNQGNNPNRGGNRAAFGGFQRGGMGGGGFQRGGFSSGQVVRASSDDFSNSVIVNAPSKEQVQVEALIKQIDQQTEQPQQPKVLKVEFASSDELAPVVQNVLTQNAPRGRGGIGTQNVPIEQRFQQAIRFGGAQAAFGTVVSEPRTNSLVVTATEENLKLVAQVVKELDVETVFENTTFVFPLQNARADQISQLMQQAFGTRQGTGNANRGNNQANRNTTTNRNNQNRNQGGGGNTRPVGLNSEQVDPNSIDLQLEDDGSLPTEVMVQQGGFGGQFRPGGQQRTTAQTGRDSQGRLVNVRDLQGQITVIPDNNTNSVIVVATPENMELLRSILAQLDKLPEQVMIETMIIEATLDKSSQFGVEWKHAMSNALGKGTGTGTSEGNFGLQNASPALQGFRYTLVGGALTGFLNALQTDTKFQVLSTPRIFTSNNVEAQINISQSIPYVLSTREDSNGNLTFNYAFQDVGIVLTVTPRITANGYVTMDVTQTANDLQGFTDFNAPIVNQRQADTTVSVRDGETIILGGIIRNNVTSTVKKIPLLGDIPLLGQLFRSTEKGNVKTELLVFLTPRIVKDPEEARKLRDDEFKRMSKESQKIIQPELNRKYDPDKDKKHSTPPPDTSGKGGGN